MSAMSAERSSGDIIIVCVTLVLMALSLYWAIVMIRGNRLSKRKLKPYKRQYGVTKAYSLVHCGGLPIVKGAVCKVMLRPQGILLEYNNTLYELPFEKIEDISYQTRETIQNHYVSSVGEALRGQRLLGDLGAEYGGRIQKITDTDIREYLVFVYQGQYSKQFITFSCSSRREAKPFVKAFKALPRAIQNVRL